MKGYRIIYIILLIILLPDILYSQVTITVTAPRLEVSGDNLVIQYDILNTRSSDFFVVWLEITDAAGNKIKAISLSGDIGNDIKGGKNKKITWNFINDSIYIDEELFFEVKAEKVVNQEEIAETKITEENKTEQKTEVVENKEAKEENNIEEPAENRKASEIKNETKNVITEESGTKEFSKGKMILTSVALPGLGQTMVNKGKPFWILGAAGYGCIAGSVLMNRSASSAYNDYKDSMDPDESNTLFNKATSRNSISKVLGYTAVGIWAADIIWVLVTPVKSKETSDASNYRKVRIIPGYAPGVNVASVSLTFNF